MITNEQVEAAREEYARTSDMRAALEAAGRVREAESHVRYGCHFELEPGGEPDSCVIDDGTPEWCCMTARVKYKEECEYWRPCGSPPQEAE